MDPLLWFRLLGRGQLAAGLVHAPVGMAVLHGVPGVPSLPLDPLQIDQPRAIDVLVDHARRQQWRSLVDLRERQGEFGLFWGVVAVLSSVLC